LQEKKTFMNTSRMKHNKKKSTVNSYFKDKDLTKLVDLVK